MDSDSITVNKRGKQTYECPDLISNLPECVISCILSFLPTKDAVRTCVLSTRWTYLWTSITQLNFDDTYLYSSSSKKKKITKKSFVNSIYRVLLHLKSMSLHSFKLHISDNYDPYHINQWISALSIRKVKKIYLYCWYKSFNIPSNILFKCHSLEELHLGSCVIQIPNPVSLSSLTVLTLFKTIINNAGNPSNNLTLNLPSLKKYVHNGCSWYGVKVSFEVPLLEVLCISDNFQVMPERVFSAVSLRRLYYSGHAIKHNIDLLAVHVASAEIILKDSKHAGLQGMNNFGKLVTTNVQRLKLYLKYPKDFRKIEYPFVEIPSFGMLVHLELDNFPTKLLLDLLLKAPCLQTLILQNIDPIKERMNFVPDCFLHTLKVVKFQSFQGFDVEFNIAKFVMENAKVLERISFSHDYPTSFKWKKIIWEEKLFSFKRSNSLAVIEIQCSREVRS